MAKKSKAEYELKPFESKTKKGKHIRIADDMMSSKAWEDLSVYARALYMEFKRKYNGVNEDDISFTYEEGKKIMSKNTFIKALDELIEHGFIYIIRPGGLNKQCTIYGFSNEWQYYGTNAFKVDKRIKGINPNIENRIKK